ncbi:MAG TPA: FAD-dependent oxidoreductase [Bacilli bacterium]|nr:FAD-dependent oxidoreductase [Bacilli bacterium]
MNKNYDLIIVGGGAAGIGAAISAYQATKPQILIIEKEKELGGILHQCIHDGFGLAEFGQELNGPEYAYFLEEKLRLFNVTLLRETTVTKITHTKEVHAFSKEHGVLTLTTKAIVITTGSYERSAGAINLPGDRGVGVYNAGQAQLLINKHGAKLGKKAFIVGSGDIGLIMARRLTFTGIEVVGVSEIMAHSSGLNRNIAQCLDDFDIPLYLRHKVVDVIGKPRLKQVKIAEIDDKFNVIPNTEKTFDVDLLLLAVGLIPLINLLEPLNVKLLNGRQVIVNNFYESSVAWIFVAGNALHIHDLADEAYAEGIEAGKSAALYVAGKLESSAPLDVTAGVGVSFVIPNYITLSPSFPTTNLKFRVTKPYINKFIHVYQGKKQIFRKFFPFLFPSELLVIPLDNTLVTTEEALKVEVKDG